MIHPDLTPAQVRALRNLIEAGYAVVVFSPEELRGVQTQIVERHLDAVGRNLIYKLTTEGPEV